MHKMNILVVNLAFIKLRKQKRIFQKVFNHLSTKENTCRGF